MLLISGHATRQGLELYEFPNVLLLEDLRINKITFYYLRHSIDGKYFSQLLFFFKGELKHKFIIPTIIFPSALRYFSEFLINILIAFLLVIFRLKKISFIGIDPLNAASGILLKYLKLSKNTIFYSVDFTYNRFSNVILNKLYLQLDLLSAKKSNQVWNVSNRIFNLRKKQKVLSSKNFLVPNVPTLIIKSFQNKKKVAGKTLVTLGILNDQLDFKNLFLAIKELVDKNIKINLKIIGTGPKEKKLKAAVKKIKIDKNVQFLGYLNHEKALKEISKSDIGLALYNGRWSFNYFGDSLKCREFFSLGLPVITTNTHSTVEDIKKFNAGLIVKMKSKAYISAIITLINNYTYYANNSIVLGNQYKNIRMNLVKNLL